MIFSSKFFSTWLLAFIDILFISIFDNLINFVIDFINESEFFGLHKKPLKLSIIILLQPGTLDAIQGLPIAPDSSKTRDAPSL